jgi:hypothetical protein
LTLYNSRFIVEVRVIIVYTDTICKQTTKEKGEESGKNEIGHVARVVKIKKANMQLL